jgi:hypothetical protein
VDQREQRQCVAFVNRLGGCSPKSPGANLRATYSPYRNVMRSPVRNKPLDAVGVDPQAYRPLPSQTILGPTKEFKIAAREMSTPEYYSSWASSTSRPSIVQ